MVWNCRGATSSAFFRYCKQYIDNYKPGVLVIVETRCNPSIPIKALRRLGYDSMESIDNTGYAGGIVVAWKSSDIGLSLHMKTTQFIHFKVELEKEEWYFTAVYASPNDIQKQLLWHELQYLASNMSKAWMIAGDFNDIACSLEKKGGLPAPLSRCKKFRDRIIVCSLNDVESRGPRFTWRGPIYHGGQRIYEKLDRALSNDAWRFQFLEAFVKVLVRVEFSDHHPILINLKEEKYECMQKPFRFENAWLLNDSYHDMMQDSWREDIPFNVNLNNVVEGIERWKFDTFDKIKRRKKEITRRLEGTQRKLQLQDNYGGMRRLEVKLQEELSGIKDQGLCGVLMVTATRNTII
ncbi:uncharacterized protein LOC131598369 [Vicia villosa]|uniref:uncharacterized protein LOC131598369 n=1 Tax=Vicia villosa TaxID=3911 RepID=UPI00273B946A|nr:uncharacterized protein LOC131598369 [Vicia villosa]